MTASTDYRAAVAEMLDARAAKSDTILDKAEQLMAESPVNTAALMECIHDLLNSAEVSKAWHLMAAVAPMALVAAQDPAQEHPAMFVLSGAMSITSDKKDRALLKDAWLQIARNRLERDFEEQFLYVWTARQRIENLTARSSDGPDVTCADIADMAWPHVQRNVAQGDLTPGVYRGWGDVVCNASDPAVRLMAARMAEVWAKQAPETWDSVCSALELAVSSNPDQEELAELFLGAADKARHGQLAALAVCKAVDRLTNPALRSRAMQIAIRRASEEGDFLFEGTRTALSLLEKAKGPDETQEILSLLDRTLATSSDENPFELIAGLVATVKKTTVPKEANPILRKHFLAFFEKAGEENNAAAAGKAGELLKLSPYMTALSVDIRARLAKKRMPTNPDEAIKDLIIEIGKSEKFHTDMCKVGDDQAARLLDHSCEAAYAALLAHWEKASVSAPSPRVGQNNGLRWAALTLLLEKAWPDSVEAKLQKDFAALVRSGEYPRGTDLMIDELVALKATLDKSDPDGAKIRSELLVEELKLMSVQSGAAQATQKAMHALLGLAGNRTDTAAVHRTYSELLGFLDVSGAAQHHMEVLAFTGSYDCPDLPKRISYVSGLGNLVTQKGGELSADLRARASLVFLSEAHRAKAYWMDAARTLPVEQQFFSAAKEILERPDGAQALVDMAAFTEEEQTKRADYLWERRGFSAEGAQVLARLTGLKDPALPSAERVKAFVEKAPKGP